VRKKKENVFENRKKILKIWVGVQILLVMFVILSFAQIFIFYGGLSSLTGRLIHQELPKGTIGEVISVPLEIGEEKKFELTGDTYYDLSVMLHSIEGSNANLKFKRVYEKISGNLNGQGKVMLSPPLVDTSGGRNEKYADYNHFLCYDRRSSNILNHRTFYPSFYGDVSEVSMFQNMTNFF